MKNTILSLFLRIFGRDDVALHDLPVLKIAYYRQRLSFGDIRTKLKERDDDIYIQTKFGYHFDDVRFSLRAGEPVRSYEEDEEEEV